MQIMTLKMKFLGKMMKFWQVVDASGEVLKVAETEQEAKDWMSAQ